MAERRGTRRKARGTWRFARSVAAVDILQQGSFSRPSEGSYQTGAETLAYAASGVRRFENRGDGYGAGLLMEGSSTNNLAADPQNITTPGYGWTFSSSATSGGAHGSILAPDGTSAWIVNFAADVNSRVRDTTPGWSGTGPHTISVWARTETGTQSFKFRIHDGTTPYDSGEMVATTTWQRFSFTVPSHAAPGASDEVGVVNWSAAARTILFAHMQLEDSEYPTSYIKTAGGTRATDTLEYGVDEYEWLRSGAFDFAFAPIYTDGEYLESTNRVLFSSAGSADEVRIRPTAANKDMVTVRGTVQCNCPAGTWSRYFKIVGYHDATGATMDYTPETGGGPNTVAPYTFTSGIQAIGCRQGSSGGDLSIDARIFYITER